MEIINLVEKKLINIMLKIDPEVEISKNDFNANTDIDDFGINSVIYIQLLVELEKEYNIEFPDEVLDKTAVKTLGELVKIIKDLIK